MTMHRLLVLAALFGAPAAMASSHEEPADEARMLPTPFTAAEIKAAMPVGLQIHWEESKNGATSYSRWTITAADDTTVTIKFSVHDKDGKQLGDSVERTSAFEDLRSHALFPEQRAKREKKTVTSAVGKGDGWQYIVSSKLDDGTKEESRYTFLRSLPGAPVKTQVFRDGTLVSGMTQVKRINP